MQQKNMVPPILIQNRRQGNIGYCDKVRIHARHYAQLVTLAEEGGYESLGTLIGVILDETLPRVQLTNRPMYELVIRDDE